jgi:eukaryotic-like serine/threonine-protein kinase
MDLVFGNRYRVEEQVGSGGMATVYRGMDAVLKRPVAVKVLHPHLASRDDARRRFNREAQAIARLHHQNIVDVYDYSGDGDEQSYLITEFVKGQTLTDFTLAHGPFLPQSAALIGHAIAGALRHAHKEGIIHRDIKPDNLMISNDGCIKLMDFGIATAVDLETMTATGAILGSPAHMAPEQIDGAEVDRRVDVFAFGTLLYYLITRHLPFMASNPHALFRKILECKYEPPSRHNPAVGRRFEEIIATCLAREPEDRFLNMDSLEDALNAYLRDHQMFDPPTLLVKVLTMPEQFELEWKPTLVQVLCTEGREQAESGSLALAIDAYNRALAIEPNAVEPRHGLSELTSKKRREKRVRVAGYSATAVALLLLLLVGVGKLVRSAAERPVVPIKAAVAIDVSPLAAPARHVVTAAPTPAPTAAPTPTTSPSAAQPQGPPSRPTASPDSVVTKAEPPRKAVRTRRNSRARAAVMPRSAGPKQASPPTPPSGTLISVDFGSQPMNAQLFLDGEKIGVGNARGIALVEGSAHTFKCIPNHIYCPECPKELEKPIKIKSLGPGVVSSYKCDFRKWAKLALPRG